MTMVQKRQPGIFLIQYLSCDEVFSCKLHKILTVESRNWILESYKTGLNSHFLYPVCGYVYPYLQPRLTFLVRQIKRGSLSEEIWVYPCYLMTLLLV